MTKIHRRWWALAVVASIVAVVTTVWAATGDGPPRPVATAPAPVLPSPATPSVPAPPSVGPSAGVSPSPSGVGRCVTATVAALSRQERVGQLLMLGTAVDDPGDVRAAVARHHLGGVFLAGRSHRSATALRADLAAVQRGAAMPLLIALDQEGGSVQTLKGPDFPLIPSAQRLGAGPPASLRAAVRDSARRLRGIGATVNLAPVADTVPTRLGEGNPPIGAFHRQYGSNPTQVAADVEQVVAASQGAGVLTILKHFPGLGRVTANTDTSTRAVDATATADDPYLEPFVAGIKAGSAGVMISSASYPKLDRANIAAFSPAIITGLLREKLGYAGLVMSDDLGAADAVEPVPAGLRAVRFVAAGGDVVLTIRPQDAAPMTKAMIAEAGRSPAFDARVTDAAHHVIQAKHRAGLLTCPS
jgi:beta-N-acetylhexosaminidase